MTHAIHHVVKCSTAPREVGVLPTAPKAKRYQVPAAFIALVLGADHTWQRMEVCHTLTEIIDLCHHKGDS